MRDPKLEYLNDIRFESDGEYLASLFVLIDLWIFQNPDDRMSEWGLSPDQDPMQWKELVSERAEMTLLSGEHLAMEEILRKMDAPWRMRLFLGFFLRCALEPYYEAAAASEFGLKSFTLYDICRVFSLSEVREDPVSIYRELEECRPSLEILFPQLFRRGQSSGRSFVSMMPMMDGRLVSVLLGENREKDLPGGMKLVLIGQDKEDRPKDGTEEDAESGQNERKAAERSAGLLYKRTQSMQPEMVVLWGREGSGKRTVMKNLAEYMQRDLLFYEPAGSDKRLDAGAAASAPEEISAERLYPELLLLRRECFLNGCIPAITGADWLSKDMLLELQQFLREYFIPVAGNVYLLMEEEEEPDFLNCFLLPMEELRIADRIVLWEKVLPSDADIDHESIEALSNTFALTPGQIRDAAAQAALLAGPEERVSENLLYQVCYAKLGHPLKGHTQRVRSPFVWDDLKMEASDKAVLRDLCECVKNRHIVMQEWNFEKRVPYGSGITALFAGPPGTGKTMAAQVIANELRMELYKVDLSQLMDKYVGETEKNIKRVFELAGRSNSVLFFDEADAIFNKRLAADSSNDRFANIESSLLLQCIEEFSGVTLLATNNMGNIDVAFLRRFRFYLLFKEPDEEIRYEIWKSVFPPEAPVKPEVDFRELANLFSFTGAIIKNVAMQAAYLAAERGEGIGILEIMVAVRREMQKEQRMLSRDMMGRYEKLYPQVIAWNSDFEKGNKEWDRH